MNTPFPVLSSRPMRFKAVQRWLSWGFALATVCALSAIVAQAQSPRAGLSRFSLSSGCGKAPASTGMTRVVGKDGRALIRTYFVLIPKDYDPHTTYSLIFVFHGANASAQASISWGLQNAKGAANAAIFVFPNGVSYEKGQAGWDDTDRGYDLPFFDNMVAEVEAGYCIDRDEVFAAGFSWGGDFVRTLGCARGDTLAAIAVNSAGAEYTDRSDYRTYTNLPCPSRQHPAVRYVHAEGGDPAYAAPAFATTSQLYRFLDQCSDDSKPSPSGTDAVSCRAFEGCAKQLVECTFGANIGHALPPNWAQDTWDFFSGFRKSDRDASHYR